MTLQLLVVTKIARLETMSMIAKDFKFKKDEVKPPEIYLGARLEKKKLPMRHSRNNSKVCVEGVVSTGTRVQSVRTRQLEGKGSTSSKVLAGSVANEVTRLQTVQRRRSMRRMRVRKIATKTFSIASFLFDCSRGNALCVDPHCKVSIGQYTKMCTSPLIFFQLHYFRCQIFEENI